MDKRVPDISETSQELRMLSSVTLKCQASMIVIVFWLIRSCLLITLINCLKGHKSFGSFCVVVKTLIVSGARTKKIALYKITLYYDTGALLLSDS